MQIALIGLPWTGKTTLFHTLAAYAGAGVPQSAPGTVARSVVRVPDPRLDELHALWPKARRVPAAIEYLDVPGLDLRRERGQGVPGAILAQIKNARALVEVIGGFAEDQPAVLEARIAGWKSDAEAIETEMLVSDLQIVENRRERIAKQMKKAKRAEDEREDALLARCEAALGDGRPLRRIELTSEERTLLAGFQLLTQKPLLRVINVGEDLAAAEAEIGARWGEDPPLAVAARIEAEIAGLDPQDRATFLSDLGLAEPALERLVRASFRILGLIAFFTVGDDEVRAWTISAGQRAQSAAGEIHSDLERGFIRAEVVAATDLLAAGSLEACRKRGTLRLEGKDYLVQDGDVLAVRFSV
jgi:GTP-binding protein YchF